MKNIICNLLILGALFISTQYKGQHLLEVLDAPFNTLIGGTPIGDDDSIEKKKCIEQGFSWSEGTHPLSSPRGCYCPLNGLWKSEPAKWVLTNTNPTEGYWRCEPEGDGGDPKPDDPEKCAGDLC